MLCKKAGLPVPYGDAFIFGIDLSWRLGRPTHFCCAWVELNEKTQKENYWIGTLLTIPNISDSLENFERMRHAMKNLIEYASDLNYPRIFADLTSLGRYLQEHGMFDAIARNSQHFGGIAPPSVPTPETIIFPDSLGIIPELAYGAGSAASSKCAVSNNTAPTRPASNPPASNIGGPLGSKRPRPISTDVTATKTWPGPSQ